MTLRPLAVTVKKGCLLLSSRWVITEIELGRYCILWKVADNCSLPEPTFLRSPLDCLLPAVMVVGGGG